MISLLSLIVNRNVYVIDSQQHSHHLYSFSSPLSHDLKGKAIRTKQLSPLYTVDLISDNGLYVQKERISRIINIVL